MNRQVFSAAGPGLVLATLSLFQPWLEQRMALHMAVEIPALFAIGWWAGRGRAPRWLEPMNVQGIAGLAAVMGVSALWMLPVALDEAVLSPAVGMAKVISLVAAGYLARASVRAASKAVQGFFVLNWAWMTGVAGLLYQQAPAQLCSTYVQGDQSAAGMGLVALSVAVAGAWLITAFRDPADARAPLHEAISHE